MRTLTLAAAAAIGAIAMSEISVGHAAEIKVISANGMREVLADTKAKFEADTGHLLTITVVETGEIRKRVLAGENFDVIMVPKSAADELEKAGKIVAGSAVQLIRVDFGLAVPNEGLKPDVIITGISHVGVQPTVQWHDQQVPIPMIGQSSQATTSAFWKDTNGAAEGVITTTAAAPDVALSRERSAVEGKGLKANWD
jgi:hypothetical protein